MNLELIVQLLIEQSGFQSVLHTQHLSDAKSSYKTRLLFLNDKK